jgi:shikimate dehydrogenase
LLSEPITRLGVLGWPVAHSRSPAIQNAALAAAGLERWRYQLLPVPPNRFGETVRALPRAGFRGANVTIPHKQAALAIATEATGRSRAIGAANTLLFEPGGIAADNTDAPALIAALPLDPGNRTALVLGAGGSARAAVWGLLNAGAEEVRVWNRTPERARELCAEVGGTAVQAADRADILVNCTPVGTDGVVDLRVHVDDYDCVVDFAYGQGETPLIAAARKAGIRTVDGLELLVGQGALSFELFTGRPAPREVMSAVVAS